MLSWRLRPNITKPSIVSFFHRKLIVHQEKVVNEEE